MICGDAMAMEKKEAQAFHREIARLGWDRVRPLMGAYAVIADMPSDMRTALLQQLKDMPDGTATPDHG